MNSANTTTDGADVFIRCGRCNGTGRVSSTIAGGVCFTCRGEGGEWVTQAVADSRKADAKRRAAAREARKAKRLAEFQARTDAAIAQFAPLGYDYDTVDAGIRSADPKTAHMWQGAVYTVRDHGVPASEAADTYLLDDGRRDS